MRALTTLDEYHASPFAGVSACVDCHMPKNAGVAEHRVPGGNVYLGKMFGDDALVQAQMRNLHNAIALSASQSPGAVQVVVQNKAGHGFPTGVTDIREPWVEVQAMDANKTVLARYGGPGQSGLLPSGAARLGIDIAKADGTVLLLHELSEATRIPFDARIGSGASTTLTVPVPSPLPQGTAELDAVLFYRNVRTTYFRAATDDASGAAEDVEVARAKVP
jgi:hypothetical protein